MTSITRTDFHVAACQATLFTPDGEMSTTQVLTELIPKWLKKFDKEPTILPSTEGLSLEIPRIVLQDSTGAWSCEIAHGRINLYWRRQAQSDTSVSLADFFIDASSTLAQYFNIVGRRVGRVAAVISRYALHPDPGKFLSQHFCKSRWLVAPFNRPENFELHAHKKYDYPETDYPVNSWVRSKTGMILTPEGRNSAILVDQDLNSLAEHAVDRAFDSEEIAGFFGRCVVEFDQILELYYEEE